MKTLAHRPTPSAPAIPISPPAPAASELAAALRRETELVRALRHALLEQRGGVAKGSAELVNASVDTIGRLLHTLAEAQQQRRALTESWAGGLPPDDPPAHRGAAVAVGRATPVTDLELARRELRGAAAAVAHEIAINRSVLRRAVENGEAFLQALFSAASDPVAVYAPAERDDAAAPGMLVNRKA